MTLNGRCFQEIAVSIYIYTFLKYTYIYCVNIFIEMYIYIYICSFMLHMGHIIIYIHPFQAVLLPDKLGVFMIQLGNLLWFLERVVQAPTRYVYIYQPCNA